MTAEYWFNSQDLGITFHKKQLEVKTGGHVSTSHSAVTAITASCDVRPYALRVAGISSGTGRGLCWQAFKGHMDSG
jgi:hypothetical protein